MLAQAIATFRNAFKVPDLRKKLLITLGLIAIYRVGCFIPVPFIDQEELAQYMRNVSRGGGLFGMVNMFTGGAFENMTIFALGIMPFISAQIIIQMLKIVWPKLEKISKEGEIGRRRIERYTRYGAIGLTAFQAFGLSFFLLNPGGGMGSLKLESVPTWLFVFTTVVAMTTGTAFIMWLGEQITDYGIGNGISLIIAVGIIAAYPSSIALFAQQLGSPDSQVPKFWVPVTIVLMVGVSLGIIYIQEGARRIPIQQAKRVVGRKVMGGASNVLPLKVNTAGVIPVIFSSAILQLPSLLFVGFGAAGADGAPGFGAQLGEFFSFASRYNLYNALASFGFDEGGIFNLLKAFNAHVILYIILTAFFCFFYTAVTFNPLDIADNLKKSGSFIPGYRPGKPTAEFIDYVLTRITVIGAVFLCGIAALPMVLIISFEMPSYLFQFVGGTGLIIVIGVVLQSVQQLEAQLMTYNYEGFRVRRRRRGDLASAASAPAARAMRSSKDRAARVAPDRRDHRRVPHGGAES
jgi:preprotein translocase subunit SecY